MLGEILSWIFSTLSNVSWLFEFLPQLLENYRNQSSEAVSYYLVLLWFIGDTLSVMSAMYKNMSIVIVYVGLYHIFFDVLFLSQVIYYRVKIQFTELETQPLLIDENQSDYKLIIRNIKSVFLNREIQLLLSWIIISIVLKFVIYLLPFSQFFMGEFLAWMATIVFLVSRLPQIYLNYKRKSVVGLSFITFALIILANNLFLASILIKVVDLETNMRLTYLINNIQWIVGASGTSIFDFIIFYQFMKYT